MVIPLLEGHRLMIAGCSIVTVIAAPLTVDLDAKRAQFQPVGLQR
jgi:hypothetical protein